MSPNGVPCNCEGSGVAEGCGVGNCGASVRTEFLPFLAGAALFLLRGEPFLVGDSGMGVAVWSGSKICEGSILSPVRVRRVRAAVLGVEGTPVVVLREARFRLFWGAGVKSSSSSSSLVILDVSTLSSSELSTTTFFLVAALLEGRVGDIVVILADP